MHKETKRNPVCYTDGKNVELEQNFQKKKKLTKAESCSVVAL